MAYLVMPTDTPIVHINDSDLATYLAAGWTQASATQIAAFHANDAYHGTQTAPPAPGKLKNGAAPAPPTAHVRTSGVPNPL